MIFFICSLETTLLLWLTYWSSEGFKLWPSYFYFKALLLPIKVWWHHSFFTHCQWPSELITHDMMSRDLPFYCENGKNLPTTGWSSSLRVVTDKKITVTLRWLRERMRQMIERQDSLTSHPNLRVEKNDWPANFFFVQCRVSHCIIQKVAFNKTSQTLHTCHKSELKNRFPEKKWTEINL